IRNGSTSPRSTPQPEGWPRSPTSRTCSPRLTCQGPTGTSRATGSGTSSPSRPAPSLSAEPVLDGNPPPERAWCQPEQAEHVAEPRGHPDDLGVLLETAD